MEKGRRALPGTISPSDRIQQALDAPDPERAPVRPWGFIPALLEDFGTTSPEQMSAARTVRRGIENPEGRLGFLPESVRRLLGGGVELANRGFANPMGAVQLASLPFSATAGLAARAPTALRMGAGAAEMGLGAIFGGSGAISALDSDRSGIERGAGVAQGLAGVLGLRYGRQLLRPTGIERQAARASGLSESVERWRGQPGLTEAPRQPLPRQMDPGTPQTPVDMSRARQPGLDFGDPVAGEAERLMHEMGGLRGQLDIQQRATAKALEDLRTQLGLSEARMRGMPEGPAPRQPAGGLFDDPPAPMRPGQVPGEAAEQAATLRAIDEGREMAARPTGGRLPDSLGDPMVTPGVKPRLTAPEFASARQIRQLHERLKPQWAETLAKQTGDEIPFTVDPTEALPDFMRRVLSDAPRELMGAERTVRKGIGDEGAAALLQRLTGGESGAVNPALLARLAGTGVGAATGAAVDSDDPLRGALIGGGMGLGATALPSLLRRVGDIPIPGGGPRATPGVAGRTPTSGPAANPYLKPAPPGAARTDLPGDAWRFPSMLSGPITHAKNIAGGTSAVHLRALEEAFGGNPKQAGKILQSFWSKQTAKDVRRAFKDPVAAGADVKRWVQGAKDVKGAKGIISRALIAPDFAARQALVRAGVNKDLARTLTFTSEPTTGIGQGFVKYINANPVLKLGIPFPRIVVNLMERNAEMMPGLGIILQKMSKGTLQTSRGKQMIGFLMAAAGATLGMPEGRTGQVLKAALGPGAMAYSTAAVGAKELREAKDFADLLKRSPDAAWKMFNEMLEATPFFVKPWQLASIPGQYVPQALKQLGQVLGAPQRDEFDTEGVPFGSTLASIPWLNTLLFDKKRGSTRSRRPSRRRPSRRR